MSIGKSKIQDSGNYTLIAKTATGDLVSSTKEDVENAPIIIDKLPEYVDVIAGKPLNLVAKLGGQPTHIVDWLKGGNLIEPSDSVKIEIKPDGIVSLRIECTQPLDMGKCALIAKNPIREDVSKSDVDVLYGPIMRKQLPEGLNVVEEKPVDLFLRVDGNPITEVIWTKDSEMLETIDGTVIKTYPTVLFH